MDIFLEFFNISDDLNEKLLEKSVIKKLEYKDDLSSVFSLNVDLTKNEDKEQLLALFNDYEEFTPSFTKVYKGDRNEFTNN